ncbi:hypothetical protein AVEN_135850-1 [Araneus ventricosus]|uniref:Uncharacterized protein n=1 Tax=Araneus ventricosus TaxID=182803 RepID=A0A4Y2SNJ7_ARAVE|nr:hypothetical protein AVEN_135850-1 [Araneus ventricosus]
MDPYRLVCIFALANSGGYDGPQRGLFWKCIANLLMRCSGQLIMNLGICDWMLRLLAADAVLLHCALNKLRTAPTAALQVVTGLQPLHLQIQQEATYVQVARARSSSNFFTVIFSPTDYESKSSGIHIHPHNFLLHNQISFAENHRVSGAKAIYTDGSKTDEGTGSAYCILENYGIIASWHGKLDHINSVFLAEILAIKMAIEAASSLRRPIKIWTHSLSNLMAILNPKSHHSMVGEIQTLLFSHKHIHLRWLFRQ